MPGRLPNTTPAARYAGKASEVTIVMDGPRQPVQPLLRTAENVLDAASTTAWNPAFSCKGESANMQGKAGGGEVDMDITHGLEPGEIEQGLF